MPECLRVSHEPGHDEIECRIQAIDTAKQIPHGLSGTLTTEEALYVVLRYFFR